MKSRAEGPSDAQTLRRVMKQARPLWPEIASVFLIDLLASPLALLTPIPLKIAVDSVIGSDPLPGFLKALVPSVLSTSQSSLLLVAGGLVVLLAGLNGLRALGATALRTRVGNALTLRFRAELFEHSQRLGLAYHDEKGASDATYRILFDTPAVQHLTVTALPQFAGAILTFGGMAYVTALISPRLAVIALLISPVLFGLGWWHRLGLKGRWREVKLLEHDAFSIAQESFNELRVVKAFGQEDRELHRFLRQSSDGMDAHQSVQVAEERFQMVLSMTTAVGTGAVLFVGVQGVLAGTITLGALLVVMSYLAQLYAPLKAISRQVTTIQNSLVMAERAFTLLDQPTGVQERSGARGVDRVEGAIEFSDVSFGYGDTEATLKDVDFAVPPGACVGIAGRTGAGKTTLLNLLVRFYDPSKGSVRLDGIDLREYKLEDLRSQFSIVLQETLLFSTSIEENIRYARPDATREEIVAAAVAANAHDFVTALPDGYETQVGQRGMRLSGGERQRISLARAFLRDSPILILDEPTSAVDIATEAGIMSAMERLMEGRTTFLVAHRLSTLRSCDILIVLHDGRILTATEDVAELLDEASRVGSVESAAERFGRSRSLGRAAG